jgi:hypothetical protein
MNGMPSFADPANLEPKQDAESVELQPKATPLEFLQAVYCNETVPLPVRMRAAIEAAPFIHPKLSVTASVNSDDFAAAMERATRRSAKAIEQPKAIEHQPRALRRV